VAAVASFLAAGGLTEVYLCGVCSCQEILRRDGRGQQVFRWLDVASGADVLMTADHGYGGGLHVLPRSGTALYCAWNRDNSGPDANIFNSTLSKLRQSYPRATVQVSTLVSHFCACIGSPCLRQCVHGA
jgi:hypothetical protein